ncbi:MAG: hypothetical protein M3Q48_11445 [Actinomycetota bacterium]|nr:hypothetical protein [Actinomycetota bacterium]
MNRPATAVVVGTGAVGARAARQLLGAEGVEHLLLVDSDEGRMVSVAASLGAPATPAVWAPGALGPGDVVVLATPPPHLELATSAVERGAHVVSVGDAVPDVGRLLELDDLARRQGATVAVAAGFSPGYTCALARHAASGFDEVDEVHVARAGTGGPACARRHHQALTQEALDWRDGAWTSRRGGSGRELCWFPDPVGAQDCYRGGLPDALVLVPAFPGVRRVTARVAATRRDRLTARLPMLRQPHPEGLLGAARVEIRGRRGPATDVRVLGALDRPAVAAGMVAGVTALWAVGGRLARPGAGGLAELVGQPVPFLHELARRGLRAAAFEGNGQLATSATPR